jgi:hypothetical protein
MLSKTEPFALSGAKGKYLLLIESQAICPGCFARASHDMVGLVIHEEGGDTHDFSERAAAQNCF